jgi:RNA polymerase sigma-70 factor (ECF subfamily)
VAWHLHFLAALKVAANFSGGRNLMTKLAQSPSLPAHSSASDEELFLRFRDRGDQTAFEQLVHRYERELYSYLARMLRDAHRAEEVFQSTFMRAYQRRQSFQTGRRLRPWLYSIATHLAVDVLRKLGRQQPLSLDAQHAWSEGDEGTSLFELLESSVESPAARMEENERSQWAREAVDALPQHLREVVLLVYFQGMKFQEAAEALEVPVGTIKSRIHAALTRLNAAWRRTEKPRA